MDPKYNPLDPRSPYFPLALSIMDDEERRARGRGPKPGCGCGCLLLIGLVLLAVLLMSLH